MKTEMELELRNLINLEIDKKQKCKEFLLRICTGYLDYYFSKNMELQQNFKKLLKKYNEETIVSFLGDEYGDPDAYIHLSLGHEAGEKDLYPMLDNDGAIYPADHEIGQIIEGAPEEGFENDSNEEMDLRWPFHDLIFFAWLSINWIEVRGYEAKIVVKTTDNNSCSSWYLNDFQFDNDSSFDGVHDWKDAVLKFTMENISMPQLTENIISGLNWEGK